MGVGVRYMLRAGAKPRSLPETRSKFPGPALTSDLSSASLESWLSVATLTSRCHVVPLTIPCGKKGLLGQGGGYTTGPGSLVDGMAPHLRARDVHPRNKTADMGLTGYQDSSF